MYCSHFLRLYLCRLSLLYLCPLSLLYLYALSSLPMPSNYSTYILSLLLLYPLSLLYLCLVSMFLWASCFLFYCSVFFQDYLFSLFSPWSLDCERAFIIICLCVCLINLLCFSVYTIMSIGSCRCLSEREREVEFFLMDKYHKSKVYLLSNQINIFLINKKLGRIECRYIILFRSLEFLWLQNN